MKTEIGVQSYWIFQSYQDETTFKNNAKSGLKIAILIIKNQNKSYVKRY